MTTIFSRGEHKKDEGNLSHSRLMVCLNWALISDSETAFFNDLISTSIWNIIRPDKIDKFVREEVFENVHDIHEVYGHDATYLPHWCNDRCFVKRVDGTFRYREIDNVFASIDN